MNVFRFFLLLNVFLRALCFIASAFVHDGRVPPHKHKRFLHKETDTKHVAPSKPKRRRPRKSNSASKFSQSSKSSVRNLLSSPSKNIPIKKQLEYVRDGHAALRNFLPPEVISTLKSELMKIGEDESRTLEAYRQKIIVAVSDSDKSKGFNLAMNCQNVKECKQALQRLGVSSDNLPFLQYFNCWRHVPVVEDFCKSPHMARTAAQLLNVESVKLYQDSLFHKRKNDGQTPWHSDARMAPFDTSNLITFWIPLQDVPADGSGLSFVSKSHADFALAYWNEIDGEEYQRLDQRYSGVKHIFDHMPLQIGDVTVHSGWTLHCASEGNKDTDRYAFAISYVDSKAEIREDVPGVGEKIKSKKLKRSQQDNSGLRDDEDIASYADWIGEVSPRHFFKHRLVPIVWPQQRRK